MKARKIGYWVSTGLVAAAFLFGGVFDLTRSPEVAQGLAHLGYPLYFAIILGAWKVLGALAIVAPGLPRLKEWAYAGIAFDLSGAFFSHAAVGDDAGKMITPLVILAITVASYLLRPDSRVLGRAGSRSAVAAAPKHEGLAAA
jgi:uncharacterized membrane protein YphA (DoxX/SURF4 family)